MYQLNLCMETKLGRYREILDTYSHEGRLRHIPSDTTGASLYNLTLNDYMGLSQRAGVFMQEFRTRFPDAAMTSSASRLLASGQTPYAMLESFLSKSYGKPALLFNSGYHANIGVISALNVEGTLWLTDKLIHASVIDGIRLAGAEYRRWPHNDLTKLRKLLERFSGKYERTIVVCESVYSMDGDMAPVRELAALKNEFPDVMLYIDEAHAIGCFGNRGLGLCEALGVMKEMDILVGTLGKACASSGAFAVTSPLLHDFLVNNARSLIFSTAIAPANVLWSLLMLEKLGDMKSERVHLEGISRKFREGIEIITGEENPSRSAIVPFMTGSARRAVALSARLKDNGILALPIRRPTVPEGGERIRFSLNATLSEKDIDLILNCIDMVYHEV